jgi:5'-nucleotidase
MPAEREMRGSFLLSTKSKILLVNDDGADAPGLWALFESIESVADPVVVAPLLEQSARGHAITIRQPMALSEIEYHGRKVGYRLDGTPADCVKLALANLYRGQIALVISGINWGANVGCNILYSGTVGAALEAAIYGLPAIAISLHDAHNSPAHFDTAARVARRLALDVLAHGLPPGVILNVNVPNLPLDEIPRAAVTRQGQETFVDLFEINHSDERTTWCTNFGGERLPSRASEHPVDDLALNGCLISITPLHFDLTNHTSFETLRDRFAGLSLCGGDDASA